MPDSGVSLQAHLIIDNNVLSMLSHYFCERRSAQLSAPDRVSGFKGWMGEQLNKICHFAPDNLIHCTDCVAAEFSPSGAFFAQLHKADHDRLKAHVCSLLQRAPQDPHGIAFLRSLTGAPRKLVGPNGLHDNDLSLVVLAGQFVVNSQPVYILTNDQDLLSFVAWVRTNRQASGRWTSMSMLQGLHGLTYLELVHRHCQFSTDYMKDLVQFALADHYQRVDLAGSQKGQSIMQQLLRVNDSLIQSVEIKLAIKGGVA